MLLSQYFKIRGVGYGITNLDSYTAAPPKSVAPGVSAASTPAVAASVAAFSSSPAVSASASATVSGEGGGE